MPQTTVNIDLRDAGFTGFANQTIKFDLTGTGTDSTSQVTIAQGSTPEEVTTDASGIAAATLWDNGNSGTQSIFQATLIPQNRVLGRFIIPADTASIDLWDLLQNYAPVGDATEQQPDFLAAAKAYTDVLADNPANNTSSSKTNWLTWLNVEDGAEVNDPTTLLDANIDVTVQAWSSNLDSVDQDLSTNSDVQFGELDIDSLILAASSVNEIETTITDNDSALPTSGAVVDYSAANRATNQKIVKQASDLSGTLDSTKVYVIDGIIDMGSQSIEVPAGGLSIIGLTFDVSQLTSSENTYDMFTSPVGGSGNLVMMDVGITTSGTGSSVFALTDATGFNAIEIKVVNFNGCTSLGYLDGYRQGLESGTGRFGGTPELEFRNAWVGGYRTETTIARGMSNFTSLFKAGSGFAYAGRVIIGMNCDLPATGAFCDFAASNIDNDESFQLSDCRVTRAGALSASDTTIYPNIDHTNVKCLWSDNAGLPNTTKYIKSNITTEVATVVSATNTYYPLAGTFTTETNSHLDMPANGEFRLLSGNGTYQLLGDFVIDGSSNDVIDMRVTKSTDGGATWPTEITHIRRQANSLVGGRDVAFFPINFIATLQEDDRVRLEIENTTSTSNLTAELDSYFIVTAL